MDGATPTTSTGLPSVDELGVRIGSVLEASPIERAPEGRRAAVLILLYERDDAPHLVLTKRAETLEHHPGQVSLPGGTWEHEDGDLGATALRETHEELGVAPHTIRLVGRLGDELTMVSGFVVAPFVGVSAAPIQPIPCEREIARVLEVSVAELLAADAALPPAPDIRSLRYPFLGEDVWGATARILHRFSAVVRSALIDDG